MGLLAVIAVPLWVLQLTGAVHLPLALPALYWHQHEMLFGFLTAAIAGFLLTAVCVWTQTERTCGTRLFLLWLVWLAGRLLLTFGAGAPAWLVHSVNLAFLPLVMLDTGWRVWQAKQTRQVMILVVLGLLWAMQIGFVLRLNPVYGHGALIMALALISIVGGRITPAFTRGGLQRLGLAPDQVRTTPKLDLAVLVTMALLLASMLLGWPAAAGRLALVAGVLTLIRLYGWKGWKVRSIPLLWVLHQSILWVPIALLLLAGNVFLGWPSNAWSHAAGTGAIGCLVLGVVARVSLGHTGRPLVLPKGLILAFVAIQLAALVRVITAFGLLPWPTGIGTSSVLWTLAYGLFLFRYTHMLASPRADGRAG
ncbi:NnrS family protein [Marinobacter sp. X15-166B]|uniref:NnrS family protein n=1 Tax=Marinobacter sp. X15-166B TaxID=1897620 RepID=UPI000A41FE56|nr:NnrS family protein [Marinobacter sp. X15-166B]